MGEATEDFRVADHLGRMAGVRSWKVAPSLWAMTGGMLWSAINVGPWPDGEENIAVCEVGHPTPATRCSCGLYALYNPGAGDLPYDNVAKTKAGCVSGIIGAAGRIIPGDLAFRAERAKILALFQDDKPTAKAEVAKAYGGIPIIRVEDFEDFCDWYGLWRYDPTTKN